MSGISIAPKTFGDIVREMMGMPTQDELSRVKACGEIVDLSKTMGKKSPRRTPRDVQHLAESAVYEHLKVNEAIRSLEKRAAALEKQVNCEHPKDKWSIEIGPPKVGGGSTGYIYRRVVCKCRECGLILFDKCGTEET